MLDATVNAFKIHNLRRKILFTLGMLLVYRFVAHVPVPGVNVQALNNLFQSQDVGQDPGCAEHLLRWYALKLQRGGDGRLSLILPPRSSCSCSCGIVPRLTELSKEGDRAATRSTSTKRG